MHVGTFAGRLGRDAETNQTPNGKSVTNFSLAVDVGWGDKKETMWVDHAIWGDRGAKLAPMLVKGKQVTTVGRIGLRTYTSKAGEPKAAITCDVQEITLQGGGQQVDSGPSAAAAGPAKAPADTDPFHSDDIPF